MSTDALPENTWVNEFLPTPPKPLHAALQRRLHVSNVHLNIVADIFKQRAAIEAQYADSLAKLAKSAEAGTILPKTSIEWDKTSGEARIYDTVVNEIKETSAAHSTVSAMIRSDFEQTLRDLPSQIVAWRRIADQDASLDKTLKEYEKTSAKLEKASTKSKSSKTDALSSELNQLTASLSTLSPMVYTTHQRLDEERLRALKEIIVRWVTARADIAQKDGERSERAVARIISWEPTEEVVRVGKRLGGLGGPRAAVAAPTLSAASTPKASRRFSTATNGTSNDFSPRPVPKQNGLSSGASNTQGGFAGGLKSILGRKSTIGPRTRSGSNATSVRSARGDGAFATIGEDESEERLRDSTPPVDADGFSVAPANRHKGPWEEPEAEPEAPSEPNTAQVFAQTFSSSPTGSVEDVASGASSQAPQKINLAITSAPIQESDEDRQAALQKIQQTLTLPPTQPSRRGTVRGRREVRNTIFGGVGDAMQGSSDGQTTPRTPQQGVGAFGLGAPVGALSKSSRQSSVASTSSNPFDSSGLAESAPVISGSVSHGLRASITEAANAILRENQVQKLQINGEIRLSLRLPQKSSASLGPIHLRINNFERLEKIAPNPTYLAQVPDKPGEYFLNSEVLAAADSATQGILLFKYQVHIPPGEESAATPLLLEPAFRTGDGESRMILKYSKNPTTTLGKLGAISLSAAFGPGPSVLNVQAKPAGGVWSPSARRMTWTPEDDSGKIVAKFTSEPGAPLTPLGVQASWKVEGELSSGLDIDVVQGDLESDWNFAEVKKALTTGKYLAEPVTH